MRTDFLEKLVDLSKNLVLWLNQDPPFYTTARKQLIFFLELHWPPVDQDEAILIEDLETCLGLIDLLTHKFADAICTFKNLIQKNSSYSKYYHYLAEAYFQLDLIQYARHSISQAQLIGGKNSITDVFFGKLEMVFRNPDIKKVFPIDVAFFHTAIMDKLQSIIALAPKTFYSPDSLNKSIPILTDYIKCLEDILSNTVKLAENSSQLEHEFFSEIFSSDLNNKIIYHKALLEEYEKGLIILLQRNYRLKTNKKIPPEGLIKDILIQKKIEDALFSARVFEQNFIKSHENAKEILAKVNEALNTQSAINPPSVQFPDDIPFEQFYGVREDFDDQAYIAEENDILDALRDLTSPLGAPQGSPVPFKFFQAPTNFTAKVPSTPGTTKPTTTKPSPSINFVLS